MKLARLGWPKLRQFRNTQSRKLHHTRAGVFSRIRSSLPTGLGVSPPATPVCEHLRLLRAAVLNKRAEPVVSSSAGMGSRYPDMYCTMYYQHVAMPVLCEARSAYSYSQASRYFHSVCHMCPMCPKLCSISGVVQKFLQYPWPTLGLEIEHGMYICIAKFVKVATNTLNKQIGSSPNSPKVSTRCWFESIHGMLTNRQHV